MATTCRAKKLWWFLYYVIASCEGPILTGYFLCMALQAVSFSTTSQYKQEPIRDETCNARSQLPNIQCELIG